LVNLTNLACNLGWILRGRAAQSLNLVDQHGKHELSVTDDAKRGWNALVDVVGVGLVNDSFSPWYGGPKVVSVNEYPTPTMRWALSRKWRTLCGVAGRPSQAQGMSFEEDALALEARRHWNCKKFGEPLELRSSLSPMHALTCVEHRPLCRK
jgi:hypothetical protein